ncbi:hypothetical protein B0H63DRAFT_478113 [Podospora didyma]|uniref:Uncharacterized protein n=1 Tax=Podospora didyma TaxID=330526 RepID=A0AAE0NBP6_9PEZI|nr:hypothetical protein B0H63DRAFT_478113 [Podospora didyma]
MWWLELVRKCLCGWWISRGFFFFLLGLVLRWSWAELGGTVTRYKVEVPYCNCNSRTKKGDGKLLWVCGNHGIIL